MFYLLVALHSQPLHLCSIVVPYSFQWPSLLFVYPLDLFLLLVSLIIFSLLIFNRIKSFSFCCSQPPAYRFQFLYYICIFLYSFCSFLIVPTSVVRSFSSSFLYFSLFFSGFSSPPVNILRTERELKKLFCLNVRFLKDNLNFFKLLLATNVFVLGISQTPVYRLWYLTDANRVRIKKKT